MLVKYKDEAHAERHAKVLVTMAEELHLQDDLDKLLDNLQVLKKSGATEFLELAAAGHYGSAKQERAQKIIRRIKGKIAALLEE